MANVLELVKAVVVEYSSDVVATCDTKVCVFKDIWQEWTWNGC